MAEALKSKIEARSHSLAGLPLQASMPQLSTLISRRLVANNNGKLMGGGSNVSSTHDLCQASGTIVLAESSVDGPS